MTRRASDDPRLRLERMALEVAFEANAVTELGETASRSLADVLAAASELGRQVDALAPELGEDDKVVRFARLVIGALDRELKQAQPGRPGER
jgi:hypothetical protein